MSEDTTANRPSQVTVAGWAVVVASALLVFSIFDAVGGLNSVDTRNELREVLSTGSDGLGISVETATEWIRWMLYVGAVAAAAAAILGFYTLRRDRTARIVLSVAAVPIVLCAPFAGGFLAAIVGASTVMLWSRPARDWFAGRPVRQSESFLGGARSTRPPREREQDREEQRPEPPAFVPPPRADDASGGGTGPEGPSPTQGFGVVPLQQDPGAFPRLAAPPQYGRMPRPRAVQTAAVVATVFAGIALAGGVVLALVLALQPDTVVDQLTAMEEWQDAGLDDDLLLPALWTWVAVLLLWCPTALALTWFTWRGSNGARIGLIVSAALAGLVGVLGFPVSLGHLIAAAATIGLLLSQPARAWFAQQGGPPPGPPPGPPQQGPGQDREHQPHVW